MLKMHEPRVSNLRKRKADAAQSRKASQLSKIAIGHISTADVNADSNPRFVAIQIWVKREHSRFPVPYRSPRVPNKEPVRSKGFLFFFQPCAHIIRQVSFKSLHKRHNLFLAQAQCLRFLTLDGCVKSQTHWPRLFAEPRIV